MDDDGLHAESATAISKLELTCFLLIHNIFTLSKKQQKCNVSEENKNFSADGSEYNALITTSIFHQFQPNSISYFT